MCKKGMSSGPAGPPPITNAVRERHEDRLALLRKRGVRRVFLVVCDQPLDACRAVGKHIWPMEEVPYFVQPDCPWNSHPSDEPWEGCEFFPHFGAALAKVPG